MTGRNRTRGGPPLRLAQALRASLPPEEPHWFPNFIPMYRLTVLRTDVGLEMRPLPLILGTKATVAGSILPSFGPANYSVPTMLLMGAWKHRRDDLEVFEQLLWEESDANPKAEAELVEKLDIVHQGPLCESQGHADETSNVQRRYFLDVPEDRELLFDRSPGGVVVIHELGAWLSSEEPTPECLRELVSWLGATGRTVVVFDSADAPGVGLLPYMPAGTDVIDLARNPSTPNELGSGCTMVRPKKGVWDSRPSKVKFWYFVNNGRFQFGIEFAHPEDELSAEEVKHKEREKQIEQLISEGVKTQDGLAARMKLSQSTIHRELKRIRERRGRK